MALGTKYEVAAGGLGCYAKVLQAGKWDEVIFEGQPGWNPDFIEVFSESDAIIHYTVNGETPVVAAANTHKLPATTSRRVVPVRAAEGEGKTLVVKLISAGTPEYDVALI